jgi:hypothetical protein
LRFFITAPGALRSRLRALPRVALVATAARLRTPAVPRTADESPRLALRALTRCHHALDREIAAQRLPGRRRRRRRDR